MTTYIHTLKDWPRFEWRRKKLFEKLAAIRYRQGRLAGRMLSLAHDARREAIAATLVEDAVKSGEIDAARFDADAIRTALCRHMNSEELPADSGPAGGVAAMAWDAARNFDSPLSGTRLLAWQAELSPSGGSIGWRSDHVEPSRAADKPPERARLQYQGPAASRLRKEMRIFLDWFNDGKAEIDPVLKAGVAHLWFATLNPFNGGNGPIARAIADLALARSENDGLRFYSMSAQIRDEQDVYRDILDTTQRSGLEITAWLEWFLDCLGRAIDRAEHLHAQNLAEAHLRQSNADHSFNARQRIALRHLAAGSETMLSSSRWAELAGCSQDTALRDIAALLALGVLRKEAGGGRSTSYSLAVSDRQSALNAAAVIGSVRRLSSETE